MAKQRRRKRVAKKKTTRKTSRVVLRKRKRIVRKSPPKRKRRRRSSEPPVEYSVNVSYRKGSKQASNAISWQMSAIGPAGATRSQVLDVIQDVIESEGEDIKRGWKVRIVSWRDGQVPKEIPWSSIRIIAGEPTTRFSVE